MKILHIRHKLRGPSPLLPGEELRDSRSDLRAVTHYCAPFNRGFYVRFLFSILLRVTDRRAMVSVRMGPLFFYRQGMDCWFPGREPEDGVDTIAAFSEATGIYGPCLEIHSRNASRRESLFSSPDLTVRVYCRAPAKIEGALREAMG